MVPVRVPAFLEEITSDPSSAEASAEASGQGSDGSQPTPDDPKHATLWFSAHEVTWDAFDAFLYRLDKADPQVPDELDAVIRPSAAFVLADRGYGHSGYPAISVNHTSASAFCEWLSAKSGRRYRLPTQAEWEAACLASDAATGPPHTAGESAGDDPAPDSGSAPAPASVPGSWIDSSRKGLSPYAWVRQTADRKTHAVGSLKPNPAGLYDMLGNAAEWCVDPDGTAVLRGGSFRDKAQDVHAGHLQRPDPSWNATDPQIPKSKWWLADADFAGFRIVTSDADAR